MPRKIRPDLSEQNKYYIPKERYYELKHYCLQYDGWKKELNRYSFVRSPSLIFSGAESHSNDQIGELAETFAKLHRKISSVEFSAKESDEFLSKYLLIAVTKDLSYPNLQTVYEIPCSRDTYYDRYRKFFWILDRIRD